ncbi:hypothetical protein [Streptomyces sp. NPDC057002]|uniref:hypothetical protein n=1 Tax=Streptomyces sp. NPDC057002 TaxID=3345992 RepID=UPI00363CDF7F
MRNAPANTGRRVNIRRSAVAGALRTLADQGRLVIPDLEAAIIQLYALLVFPHTVFSTYGTHIEDSRTARRPCVPWPAR